MRCRESDGAATRLVANDLPCIDSPAIALQAGLGLLPPYGVDGVAVPSPTAPPASAPTATTPSTACGRSAASGPRHGDTPAGLRPGRWRCAPAGVECDGHSTSEVCMRVSASFLAALVATLVGTTAAHAQAADKAQPAAAASIKAQGSAKPTPAQAKSAAANAGVRPAADGGKAKIEGVSTLRSAPADSKKDGGCQHGTASDA
jgi:hypothetical protein